MKNSKKNKHAKIQVPDGTVNDNEQPSLRPIGFTCVKTILFLQCMKIPRREQEKKGRRGPPGSTIIILLEIIRFNNNHYPTIPWDGISRQGAPFSEGFFPHFVGGICFAKSLLLTPYPAIPPYVVRTLHPGSSDDREHITT